MSTFVLKEGAHYHRMPPFSSLPWLGSRSMVRDVTFDASCAYESDAYYAQDVNKLFGLSFGLGGVHHNSARFGWRYNATAKCIELLAYVYKEGVRNQDAQLQFPVVAQVQLGQRVRCEITAMQVADGELNQPIYTFAVTGSQPAVVGVVHVDRPTKLPAFGLTHGLYYGGELTAPHEMRVRIDRV